MDDANPETPTREFFYCGTSTGDILAVNMKSKNFQFKAPLKNNFENGITSLVRVKKDRFLVGTGCGKLYELYFPLPEPDDEQNKGQKKQQKTQPKPVVEG